MCIYKVQLKTASRPTWSARSWTYCNLLACLADHTVQKWQNVTEVGSIKVVQIWISDNWFQDGFIDLQEHDSAAKTFDESTRWTIPAQEQGCSRMLRFDKELWKDWLTWINQTAVSSFRQSFELIVSYRSKFRADLHKLHQLHNDVVSTKSHNNDSKSVQPYRNKTTYCSLKLSYALTADGQIIMRFIIWTDHIEIT
jgi:hypothetical protein